METLKALVKYGGENYQENVMRFVDEHIKEIGKFHFRLSTCRPGLLWYVCVLFHTPSCCSKERKDPSLKTVELIMKSEEELLYIVFLLLNLLQL